MSTDDKLSPEKFRGSGERRSRERTRFDAVAMRKRKQKSRVASKVARATRKKQRGKR